MAARAVIFDCDGVLLDSNRLKVELFRATATETGFAPADVDRFSAFQAANFGTSRFRLFETLLRWDLEVRPAVTVDELVEHYAGLLADRYAASPETPGMREIVARLGDEMPLFVASGSAQEELRGVFAQRGDAGAFEDILGSPVKKDENVASIVATLQARDPSLPSDQIWFVGDAEADLAAATGNGLRFVYMDAFSTVQERMRGLAAEHGFPVIDDLRGLPAVLAAS